MKVIKCFPIIVLVVLAACSAMKTPETPLTVTHVTSLNAAVDAFASETTLVIHDQKSWEDLWSKMIARVSPAPPVPAVDFTKNVLLVAASGTQVTGGYSMVITDATESSGSITVNVTASTPGSSCVVSQGLSSPVDLATIPLRDGMVSFNITRKTQSC